MYAKLIISDRYSADPRPFASIDLHLFEILPKEGERLLFASDPDDDWTHSAYLHVQDVITLSDLRGYFISLALPSWEDDPHGVFLEERKLRRLLDEEGWDLHAPRRPLPKDFDLEDDDEWVKEKKTLNKF